MSGEKKAKSGGALLGAAFLMATSAIGPGFLTQTSKFTGQYGASFGFVILASIILAAIAQLNIWRVLCSSGLRGQEVANKILPGLGIIVAILVAFGGLVFNIGNVGGGALGFTTLFGVSTPLATKLGCAASGIIAIAIFLVRNAKTAVDTLTKILGGVMIVTILIIIFIVHPPIGSAVKNTFVPETGYKELIAPILTLLGGTVGGYITFAGAHRLIDAGIVGKDNLKEINRSSLMGMGIATIVRIFLFLAVLGVVTNFTVDIASSSNPAAEAFTAGAGTFGTIIAGLVLLCAALTSIIGAAYTSVSFIKTFHPALQKHENAVIIVFIAVSTIIMIILGASPAVLLVLAGAVNGLILPITLGICLIAAKSKRIMGEDYHHPTILFVLGIIVVIITAYLGVTTFVAQIGKLFV